MMKLLYRFKHRHFRLPRVFTMRNCTFENTPGSGIFFGAGPST